MKTTLKTLGILQPPVLLFCHMKFIIGSIFIKATDKLYHFYFHLVKVADVQDHNGAMHCELVDRLFSNGQNVYRAEDVCLVLIITLFASEM